MLGVNERIDLKLFGRELIFQEFQPWLRPCLVTALSITFDMKVKLDTGRDQASYVLSTLSQKSETVAENGDCRRIRRVTFLRQCGQDIRSLVSTLPISCNMANFRPVSNLTFMSKVIERAVTKQLNECLTDHDLLPRDQSAYRKQHSTETAILRDTVRLTDRRR